ncbi:MAG: metallophosphoesterase family protein, partial [Planctomycetota bacterium]
MEEWKIRRQNTVKFISTVLFLAVLPSTSFAQKPWKFIVTCDSRGYSNGINEIILSELVNEIKSQGVDFLLFPGDLVSGYSATGPSEFESQLRTWVEVMEPVYDANIPIYVSRGNHEIGDVWGVYSHPDIDPNDNYATRWLNVFGSDFHLEQKLPDNGPADEKYMTYSVTHKNAFIVSLDQYAGINHEAVHKVNQKWLDAQLAANTKPHIFVAG